MELKKVFKIIQDNIEDADFAGSIKKESILKAKNILNVNLPKSYEGFIEKYGCGDIFGIEIFGIVSDSNIEGRNIPSFVWLTKELRKDGLPNNYIPISESGDGFYYILDTLKMNDDFECPVLIWSIGNLKTEIVSSSFASFLFETLSDLI